MLLLKVNLDNAHRDALVSLCFKYNPRLKVCFLASAEGAHTPKKTFTLAEVFLTFFGINH